MRKWPARFHSGHGSKTSSILTRSDLLTRQDHSMLDDPSPQGLVAFEPFPARPAWTPSTFGQSAQIAAKAIRVSIRNYALDLLAGGAP
jgi:hypothetical protein